MFLFLLIHQEMTCGRNDTCGVIDIGRSDDCCAGDQLQRDHRQLSLCCVEWQSLDTSYVLRLPVTAVTRWLWWTRLCYFNGWERRVPCHHRNSHLQSPDNWNAAQKRGSARADDGEFAWFEPTWTDFRVSPLRSLGLFRISSCAFRSASTLDWPSCQ